MLIGLVSGTGKVDRIGVGGLEIDVGLRVEAMRPPAGTQKVA